MIKHTIQIPAIARCLAVDDNERHINWFLEHIPRCETALTPAEAIITLDTQPKFDIVFLDHDAGGRQFVDPTDERFWRVAQRLHRMEYSGVVIIHSHNSVGASRMDAMLGPTASVSILPFGTFEIEITKS